jgi:hypothetical protein
VCLLYLYPASPDADRTVTLVTLLRIRAISCELDILTPAIAWADAVKQALGPDWAWQSFLELLIRSRQLHPAAESRRTLG